MREFISRSSPVPEMEEPTKKMHISEILRGAQECARLHEEALTPLWGGAPTSEELDILEEIQELDRRRKQRLYRAFLP